MSGTQGAIPSTQHSPSSQRSSEKSLEISLSRGLIKGHYLEICLASCILVLPMLISSVVLIGLVYTHLMTDERSTYSQGGRGNITLGSAYYVNYPATQLVFFSSVSSTLAPLLFSPIMALFSYFTAYSMTKESDGMQIERLTSPFQLVLLVKMLEAKIMSLWSTFLYAFGSKKKREAVVPGLRKAAGMLFGMVVLAILIFLADIWLHIATDSVQYLQVQPVATPSGFAPSRGFPEDCLKMEAANNSYHIVNTLDCHIVYGAVESGVPILKNHAEVIRTADDHSESNKIIEIDGVSMLGPANPPLNVDFKASSFGSHTTCEIVTNLCGSRRSSNHDFGLDVSFTCEEKTAGVDYWGWFANLDHVLSHFWYQRNETHKTDMTLAMGGGVFYDLQIIYYDDDNYLFANTSSDPNAPTDLFSPRQWWAIGFVLPPVYLDSKDKSLDMFQLYESLGLVETSGGKMGGIAKCSTNMSYVDYESKNGTTSLSHSSLLDRSAPAIFTTAIMDGFGWADINRGLQMVSAQARNRQDFAEGIAQAYDRAVVSLGAAVAVPNPPGSMSQYKTTLVARVPFAPFWAVVALNMIYALIGIALTILALCVVGIGHGVRDTQARLSLEAVAAESFENPAFGDDAKSVDALFAERRGLPARRIALVRRNRGARRFKQVVQSSRQPTMMI